MKIKLKAVKCINLVPEVGAIEKCYVKAISRNLTSLNIEGTLFKPLGPPIYVIIICSHCRPSYWESNFLDWRKTQLQVRNNHARSHKNAKVRVVQLPGNSRFQHLLEALLPGHERLSATAFPQMPIHGELAYKKLEANLKFQFRATSLSITWRSTQSFTRQCSQKASTRVNWTSPSMTHQLATVGPSMISSPIWSIRFNDNKRVTFRSKQLSFIKVCYWLVDTSKSDKIFLIASGYCNHELFWKKSCPSMNYDSIGAWSSSSVTKPLPVLCSNWF